jgi:hypothetical protein
MCLVFCCSDNYILLLLKFDGLDFKEIPKPRSRAKSLEKKNNEGDVPAIRRHC